MPEMNDERKGEIVAEYNTLKGQNQDEQSIIKALTAKYGLNPSQLGKIMQDNLEEGASPAAKSVAEHEAEPGQMGERPPKGTIQGSDAPKGKK